MHINTIMPANSGLLFSTLDPFSRIIEKKGARFSRNSYFRRRCASHRVANARRMCVRHKVHLLSKRESGLRACGCVRALLRNPFDHVAIKRLTEGQQPERETR